MTSTKTKPRKRKGISKKLRFEIFKRDGFKCAYCGKEPPAVTLEIDHIEPFSKGGEDDINNYITACFDCNRGKSNICLSKIPPQISENLDALKEKEAQLKEYRKYIKKIKRRELKDINDISKIYTNQYNEWALTDTFKKISLKKFLSLLPKDEVEEALYVSINKFPEDHDAVIKYFCGVCWNKINFNKPCNLIKKEWIKLSRERHKGIGYFNKADIKAIKDIPLQKLKEYMVKALSKRSNSYWRSFMDLLANDGLL